MNWTGEWKKVGASTKYPIQTQTGSYFCYPIKIVKIAFYLTSSFSDGVYYSGKFLIDDLSITYPVKITLVQSDFAYDEFNFKLYQNFPNPFNSITKLKFVIPKSISLLQIDLKVYDVLGREVAKLFSGKLNSGIYEVVFDSSGLPSGVYFCVLSAGDLRETIKMVLLK